MQIEITGDTSKIMKIALTHEGKTIRADLFSVRAGWLLSGQAVTSIDGYRIGNTRTHWPRAIEVATDYMREVAQRTTIGAKHNAVV